MIVTRRRQRRPSYGRFVLPLLALAALAFAFAWPPSQRIIATGPLKPAWDAGAGAGGVLARPLTFAAQQQALADRNREIRELDGRLEQERRAKVEAEARLEALQQHLSALANQPAPVVPPRAAPTVAPVPFGAAARAPGESRRLAATWAAMEPEKAAAVVQRLPDDQVSRVLGQMDADSAGAILNALPANVAARISRGIVGQTERTVRTP